MTKQWDVIGLGDPFQDLVIRLSQLPPSNVNMQMDDFCFQGGGNVSTALVASARLGLRAALIGNVGDDIFGRMITADLKFNQVDVSHVRVNAGKRSNFCLCIAEEAVDGKEFISKGGDFQKFEPSDLDRTFFESTHVLHIGNFTPAIEQACDWVHGMDGVISIDAAYYRPDIYSNYRRIDIFIGSETYFKKMCEYEGIRIEGTEDYAAALCRISEQGPRTVIFTLGEKGCIGVSDNRFFEIPAFKVEAIDPTGAGDVFHGAYIYGWLQGWSPEKCCSFSSAVSAIKCTRLGGRSGIPTMPIVEKFMEEGIIDGSELDLRLRQYQFGLPFSE
jgi:sugar/nucleoside kinase (ribokinase family)